MPPLRRSPSPSPDLQGRGGEPRAAGRIRRPLPRICKGKEGRGWPLPDPWPPSLPSAGSAWGGRGGGARCNRCRPQPPPPLSPAAVACSPPATRHRIRHPQASPPPDLHGEGGEGARATAAVARRCLLSSRCRCLLSSRRCRPPPPALLPLPPPLLPAAARRAVTVEGREREGRGASCTEGERGEERRGEWEEWRGVEWERGRWSERREVVGGLNTVGPCRLGEHRQVRQRMVSERDNGRLRVTACPTPHFARTVMVSFSWTVSASFPGAAQLRSIHTWGLPLSPSMMDCLASPLRSTSSTWLPKRR
uniref:Uncharacterized protein n=1 Tax=Oryza meridionalis TaxID=40149 RepID=A0A0E0EW75_9ORYZ